MQQRTRHPMLEHLDALVGEWETEAAHLARTGLQYKALRTTDLMRPDLI